MSSLLGPYCRHLVHGPPQIECEGAALGLRCTLNYLPSAVAPVSGPPILIADPHPENWSSHNVSFVG